MEINMVVVELYVAYNFPNYDNLSTAFLKKENGN